MDTRDINVNIMKRSKRFQYSPIQISIIKLSYLFIALRATEFYALVHNSDDNILENRILNVRNIILVVNNNSGRDFINQNLHKYRNSGANLKMLTNDYLLSVSLVLSPFL